MNIRHSFIRVWSILSFAKWTKWITMHSTWVTNIWKEHLSQCVSSILNKSKVWNAGRVEKAKRKTWTKEKDQHSNSTDTFTAQSCSSTPAEHKLGRNTLPQKHHKHFSKELPAGLLAGRVGLAQGQGGGQGGGGTGWWWGRVSGLGQEGWDHHCWNMPYLNLHGSTIPSPIYLHGSTGIRAQS